MSKFQKSAIVLGAIYLVFRIVGLIMNHPSGYLWGPEETATLSSKLMRLVPYFIANTCFVLFLLFNALHHKSTAAKTTAIIGGVFWILLISHYILNIIHIYRVCHGGHFPYYIHSIWIVLNISLEALLIIAIGFFADSNRKNKAVLISSIVGIGVLFLCNLYSLVIYPHFYDIISSAAPEIDITISLLNLLAMSSLILCAATVKEKK